jgi:hypothetical protein
MTSINWKVFTGQDVIASASRKSIPMFSFRHYYNKCVIATHNAIAPNIILMSCSVCLTNLLSHLDNWTEDVIE